MLSGDGIRDAARACTPFDRPLATGPACPSWPATFAPVSWIASVSRARPGRRLGVDDDDFLLRTPLGSHGQVGDRGQADTAPGRRQVIVDELVGDQAVRRAALERGRLDRTVAQPHRSELSRLEDATGHQRSRVLRMNRIVLSAVATCFS